MENIFFDYINNLDQDNWLFTRILYIGSIELKVSIVMYLYSIAAEQNCHILRSLKHYKYMNRVSKSLDSRHWLAAFSLGSLTRWKPGYSIRIVISFWAQDLQTS